MGTEAEGGARRGARREPSGRRQPGGAAEGVRRAEECRR